MKRKLRTLEEYRASVGSVHERIVESIRGSVEDWNKIQNFSNDLGMGPDNYRVRTKAAVIHDHISHRVMNEFFGDSDIQVKEFNGVFGFLYKEKFFIRFKKMNPKGFSTSNVPTNQNNKYIYQNSLIEGLPRSPTILYAGYSLDKTQESILGIYLVCRDGDSIEWVDEHGVYDSQQISFNFDDISTSEGNIEKVISRIRAKKKKQNESTGTDI